VKMSLASPQEIDAAKKWANTSSAPGWANRIVWGFCVLLDNCADKTLDYIDFNPEIKKAKKAAEVQPELIAALEGMIEVAEAQKWGNAEIDNARAALLKAKGGA
jgi:hypothetical protein